MHYPRELDLIAQAGITVHHLAHVVGELKRDDLMLKGAAGLSLSELVALAGKAKEGT